MSVFDVKNWHAEKRIFGTDSGPNSADFALTDPNVRIETKSSLNIPDGKGKLDQNGLIWVRICLEIISKRYVKSM